MHEAQNVRHQRKLVPGEMFAELVCNKIGAKSVRLTSIKPSEIELLYHLADGVNSAAGIGGQT